MACVFHIAICYLCVTQDIDLQGKQKPIWEDTEASHLSVGRPFCLWDSETARIMNSEISKRLFVSAFHLLISFILLAGFFHLGHKHCHHTWQKFLQGGTCLVSHGKRKQTNKKLYSSNWRSQSHKTLDQSPKANGTKYVAYVSLNISTFFRNKGITVIWIITQLLSITE